jgi:hypothetical protein
MHRAVSRAGNYSSVVPVGRYSAGINVVLVGRHSLGRCDVGAVKVPYCVGVIGAECIVVVSCSMVTVLELALCTPQSQSHSPHSSKTYAVHTSAMQANK